MRAKGAKRAPAKKKQQQKEKKKEKGEKPTVSKRPKKKEQVAKKQKKAVEVEEEGKKVVEPIVEPRVVEEEKEEERKAPSVPLSAPRAIMPSPQVTVRHEGSMMERDARGYSWGELSAAGIEQRVARTWGVPIDIRRRSTVTGNVEKLRAWFQTREPATRSAAVTSVPPAPAGKKK